MSSIIGLGFLGKAFFKKKKFINNNLVLFTAGVSNSSSINKKEYSREINKINNLKLNQKQILVYFSTCGIFDPSRKKKTYFKHKILVEKIIKNKFRNYLIIRLPEVIGKNKNKKTLINFIYSKLISNKKFRIFKNTKRNLLDIDDIINISLQIFKKKLKNQSINIANPDFISPIDIVKIFENIIKKKANYSFVIKRKKFWNINISKIKIIIPNYEKKFNKNYISNSIRKNYIR